MPERSFGRTVRYRRTKMGLSQAKLGDLVGRSASTIRSWERDVTTPNDPQVITALAAVLGIDPRILFEKGGLEVPVAETSPTMEQALATLRPSPTEWEASPLTLEEAADAQPQTPGPVETSVEEAPTIVDQPVRVEPRFVSSRETLKVTAPTPPLVDASYIEDASQRQLYRVRILATIVVLVALAVVFVWSLANAIDALSTWWDDFFGGLRL